MTEDTWGLSSTLADFAGLNEEHVVQKKKGALTAKSKGKGLPDIYGQE
jgi:hypothetical protein